MNRRRANTTGAIGVFVVKHAEGVGLVDLQLLCKMRRVVKKLVPQHRIRRVEAQHALLTVLLEHGPCGVSVPVKTTQLVLLRAPTACAVELVRWFLHNPVARFVPMKMSRLDLVKRRIALPTAIIPLGMGGESVPKGAMGACARDKELS